MSSAFFGTIIKAAGQKFYNVDGNFLIECMIDDLGNKNSNKEKLIYIENIIDFCKTQLYEYEILNKNDEDFEIIHKASNEFIKKIKNIKMTYNEKNIKEPEQQERKKEKELKMIIQWRGANTDLYYLLNQLEDKGFLSEIDRKNFELLIEKYFLAKEGKPFKKRNIKQGTNNLLDNEKSAKKSKSGFKIDDIVDKLRKPEKKKK